jgi:tripartite-type tricarboxylate transporter receptor subunit TctC
MGVLFRLTLTAFALFACTGHAQNYPNRPVRLIVPFVPGGSADFFARALAPDLSEALGQPVVIDNRGGAAGVIGTELAARAAADGYTLLLGTANTAMNVSLYKTWSVDPVKDLKAVALLGSAPNMLAVNPAFPAKNVKELIALAQAKPGQINYASGGSGSTSHLATELFKALAHVNLVHVPYKGTGPAVVATVSGEAMIVIPPASVVLPQDKAGRLRAIATCSLSRLESAPQIPTVAESGVPGYEAAQWYGIIVPAATPDALVRRLNRELVKVVQTPDFRTRMLKEATTVSGTSAEEFAAYLKSEIAKWAKVVRISGAHVE